MFFPALITFSYMLPLTQHDKDNSVMRTRCLVRIAVKGVLSGNRNNTDMSAGGPIGAEWVRGHDTSNGVI